ncbi:flippase [Vibrio mangrovi]|uniref:Flippase n=1 Tax=Vibrio mangrovi TaxID=474394 RepID=A0A1Y6IXW6_9VIBR|nr:flippase [Vibrio mangrovi]MDW6003090.1 flippase [Vibrio mangrovi]SMS01332.1 Polysaccharide biosynthesis protein [Vibrio mangrovi]
MSNIRKLIWFSLDNLGGVFFGLFSIVFIARIYGPTNMGYLSYIQALASILSCVFILGMDNVVMKEYVQNPEKKRVFYAVSLVRLFGGLVFFAAVFSWAYFFSNTPDELVFALAFSACVTTYFGKSSAFRLYFQASEQPRILSVSTVASRVAAIAYILGVIYFQLSFVWAILYLVVYSVVAQIILLSEFYRKTKDELFPAIADSIQYGKKILYESKFVFLSSIIFPIFMYFDVVIIEKYLTPEDVGLYGVATKLVMQLLFVGHIFVFAFFTRLNKEINEQKLDGQVFRNIVRLMIYCSVGGGIFVSLTGDYIVHLLYGEQYDGAGIILKILIWKLVFSYFGALFSRVLIIRQWTNIELIKTVIASTVSLSASMIAVQIWGATGVATVSVVSYAIADLFSYLLFARTRIFFIVVVQELVRIFTRPVTAFRQSLEFLVEGRQSYGS